MLLPEPADMCVLLVRTDYSDEAAWLAALDAATAVYDVGDFERSGTCLQPVEASELASLTPPDLVLLPRAGYLSLLAVADARTMRELTIMFVDLNQYNGQIGRTFRAIPEEIEPITANLVLANMDFRDFADSADLEGVFRGF
jgi:hypothetical protein